MATSSLFWPLAGNKGGTPSLAEAAAEPVRGRIGGASLSRPGAAAGFQPDVVLVLGAGGNIVLGN